MEHTPHNQPPFDTQPSVHTIDQPQKKDGFWREVLRFSFITLLIVFPIRLFIAQPFIVSGASMEQTFSTGQYLIVDQLSYHFENPARGDVIVFKYPLDPSKYFIKRVIGIPGDTVAIENGTVTISNQGDPKGTTLSEPYVRDMQTGAPLLVTLKDGEYFVMGDNRDASSDSRVWGTLPANDIVGRAFLRLFPLNAVGVLPGEYDIGAELNSNVTK